MSSSGTSLARTRSLRKPTAGSNTDLGPRTASTASSTAAGAGPKDRNTSPSRLPGPRPVTRSTAAPAGSNDGATGAAPSFLKRNRAATSGQTGRSGSVSSKVPPATAGPATQASRTQDATQPPQRQPTRSRYPPNASASNTISGPIAGGGGSSGGPVKRPTSSGGLPSQNKTRSGIAAAGGLGHARAKSTVTGSAAAAALKTAATEGGMGIGATRGISNAPVLRPPSQTSSNSSGATAATTATTTIATATATRSRPISTHARSPSAGERLHPSKQPPTAPGTTAASSRPAQTAAQRNTSQPGPSTTTLAREAPKLTKKPAFNTNQQHYSPLRKAGPKPLTATYLAPPSPSKHPANVALTAETTRLQTEILQLHLLHRDAALTEAQWHASAKEKLAGRHADLAAHEKDLADAEADIVQRRNIAALEAWGGGAGNRLPLPEKIQVLDAILTGLWSVDAPGGRYARIRRRFERWADRLVEIEDARRRGRVDTLLQLGSGASTSASANGNGNGNGGYDDMLFVGGMDSAWKDEVAGLKRRLQGWQAQMDGLGFCGGPPRIRGDKAGDDQGNGELRASSLALTLDGARRLVDDMLAELGVMEDIEAAALQKEAEWIQNMIREGEEDTGEGEHGDHEEHEYEHDDTPRRAGAIWRIV